MGARHSKRSVDITTTPKKTEDGAVIEGEEGKLEKIAEPDLKVTTNGTLHTEIEFADKEETSKDETEDKEKVESKSDVKENGLPEEPSNAVSECKEPEGESEKSSEQVNGEAEKSPEKETSEQKVEETTEQKKKKEKKKKWSFRSISFSKKDKSKPSKESSSEKNGDVKEVAEEIRATLVSRQVARSTACVIEEATATSAIAMDAPQVTANYDWWTAMGRGQWGCLSSLLPAAHFVLLGLALAVVIKLCANSFGQRLERFRRNAEDKAASQSTEEMPKSEETKPTQTAISEDAAESVKQPEAESPKATEEQTKPSEEPASDVKTEPKVEDAKPEAPKEKEPVTSVPEPVVEPTPTPAVVEEAPKVEEPSKEVRTEEVPPPLPSSNPPSPVTVFAESTKAEAALTSGQVPLEETKVVQEVAEASVVAPVEMEAPKVEESALPEPPVASEQDSVTETVAEPLSSSVPEVLAEIPQEQSVESLHSSSSALVVPLPPSPSPLSDKESDEKPINVSTSVETKDPDPSPSMEDLPPAPPSPIPYESSNVAPEPTMASMTETITDVPPILQQDISTEQQEETEAKPPAEPIVPDTNQLDDESKSSFQSNPSTPPPTPAASTEVSTLECPSNIELPTVGSPPPPSDISEPVAPADSLPDISTESLPSLPEPISESLAPMSLPPVDSVPEPIVLSETSVIEPIMDKELSPAALTNGNMNGHSSPSPTDDAVLESQVPGPTKQIATDAVKESEISPEAGDKPSETAVVTAEE